MRPINQSVATGRIKGWLASSFAAVDWFFTSGADRPLLGLVMVGLGATSCNAMPIGTGTFYTTFDTNHKVNDLIKRGLDERGRYQSLVLAQLHECKSPHSILVRVFFLRLQTEVFQHLNPSIGGAKVFSYVHIEHRELVYFFLQRGGRFGGNEQVKKFEID